MKNYKKKPVVIQAIQLTDENEQELNSLMKELVGVIEITSADTIQIRTLEGVMIANWGDWIIRGINGEYYPCKPDIFEKSYSPHYTPPNLNE